MTTKEQVISVIKEWIDYDSKISDLQKQMRELRSKKKSSSDKLIEIMKENELECFNCNSGRLVYTKNKVKQPINKKTLQETLMLYYKNEKDVSDLTNFILENRKETIKESIKRKN